MSSDLLRLNLIGDSQAFRNAVALIRRISGCRVSVLLRGETGTGKELAARAIHYLGLRPNGPFVPLNCGAIPETLVESELFGHSRGAFTDARDPQSGLVAQADGGTLFLDEVDALSPKAQIALLRFLQDGTYRPLGAKTTRTSNARIVAATNADLAKLEASGAFRSDLLFRLMIMPLDMPPLRERSGDIALLAQTFLDRLAEQYGRGRLHIDRASLLLLECYHWPGNVRELANVIHREFLLTDGECLQVSPSSLMALKQFPTGDSMVGSFNEAKANAITEFERTFLRRALADSGGNVSVAAQRAGKERRSFGKLLKKHGIDKSQYSRSLS